MSTESNSTAPDFRMLGVNTVALDIVQYYARNASGGTVELALSSFSFGVLTVLSFTSIYFLIRRGSPARTSTGARIPLLGILTLYLSTGTYMAALIWNQSSTSRWVAAATAGLSSPSYDGREEIVVFEDLVLKQSWMLTIATILNFVVGDAIVWWRACVIWQHRAVYCVGSLLVTLTLVLGIAGVYVSAQGSRGSPALVVLLSANACALAAVSSSLATNVLATALIAYKAWEHRRVVKKQLAAAGTRSQVLQVLALLVESGSIYCALMAFSVVTDVVPLPETALAGVAFYRASAYITRGCIIPVAAIYPAGIIVLVALQRSPIDTVGLSRAAQAHPRGEDWNSARGQARADVEDDAAEASDTIALPSHPALRGGDGLGDAVDSRCDVMSASVRDGRIRGTPSLGLDLEPWMAMPLEVE